jgi:hypothetical protein
VKKRFGKILVSYGIPLFILFAALSFSRTAPYWSWHLIHGFHAETNGIQVWVPLSYRAAEIKPQRGLILLAYQGLFPTPRDQVKAGTMMVDFVDSGGIRSPLEIRLGTGPIILNTEGPFHKESERTATMAGQTGVCIEYAGDASNSSSALIDQDIIKVYCWFGDDLRASFLGASLNKQNFFEMIASAKQEKGNIR